MLQVALLLGVLVLGPAVAYPLLRYPAWALMYTIDPAELELAPRLLLLAAAPLAVLFGAQLGSGMLRRRAHTAGVMLTSLAGALSAGLAVWGLDRLWRVGSWADYLGETRSFMPTLFQHRLGAALLLVLPALVLAWWYGVHTLREHRHHDAEG